MLTSGPNPPLYTVAMHDDNGVINVHHFDDVNRARLYARIISTSPGLWATLYLGKFEKNELPLRPYETWIRGEEECQDR
jgi:hypothetical protein